MNLGFVPSDLIVALELVRINSPIEVCLRAGKLFQIAN